MLCVFVFGASVLVYELSLLIEHDVLLLAQEVLVPGILVEEVLSYGGHVPLEESEQFVLRRTVHLLLQVPHEVLLGYVVKQEVLHETLHQHVSGPALLLGKGNQHKEEALHLSNVVCFCRLVYEDVLGGREVHRGDRGWRGVHVHF